MEPSAGLLTDLYELTMADAYIGEGLAETTATFSLFVRALPAERGFLVAAGLDAALAYLESLHFSPADIDYLDHLDLFGDETLGRLAELRFTGSVRAMPEGTIAFGAEPLLEVTGPLIEAQLAETFVLNQVTTETTLASKAARYRQAARGRPVVDFGFRRTQGLDAALKLVRVGALCGLNGTSNVAGAQRYGVALSGTMAHSYVQVHTNEAEAFARFAGRFGPQAVLLVDTYDVTAGIEHAVEIARRLPIAAIRLDSGDLENVALLARTRLDDEGLNAVKVMASGGLDELMIDDLLQAGAPIDGFGVGSDLGVSRDVPVLDTVYKLVSFDGRPIRKLSPGKRTWPGEKQVWRRADWSGDVLALDGEPITGHEALLTTVMVDGARTDAGRVTLDDANKRFEAQWAGLPEPARRLRRPEPVDVRPSPKLVALARSMDDAGD